jgi:hypothetical protein
LIGRGVLGDSLDGETSSALAHAESPNQSVALFLASPIFQWR